AQAVRAAFDAARATDQATFLQAFVDQRRRQARQVLDRLLSLDPDFYPAYAHRAIVTVAALDDAKVRARDPETMAVIDAAVADFDEFLKRDAEELAGLHAAVERRRNLIAGSGSDTLLRAAGAELDTLEKEEDDHRRRRAEHLLALGDILRAAGRYERANLAYGEAKSLAPKMAEIPLQKGILLKEQGQHAAAVREFQEVFRRTSAFTPEPAREQAGRLAAECALLLVREIAVTHADGGVIVIRAGAESPAVAGMLLLAGDTVVTPVGAEFRARLASDAEVSTAPATRFTFAHHQADSNRALETRLAVEYGRVTLTLDRTPIDIRPEESPARLTFEFPRQDAAVQLREPAWLTAAVDFKSDGKQDHFKVRPAAGQ
ncbi:MAG: hypothetical protein HY719_14465, partial [Planctomycetes bacterium]|nr:hypothetical protein [Planctomycetota bacterium]